ncbi:MAG: tRNA pseudouridine synthase A, partial [Candidatus Zixiibacteriota bacterium]
MVPASLKDSIVRYRLDLAYHGRDFHGWQLQPGLRTVQGELETWLGRLLRVGSPVAVTGAGRTDTGVHAAGMVAHFDADAGVGPDELLERLGRALPPDLVVISVVPVDPTFHARYSATGRHYSYRIATRPTPFGRDRHWLVTAPLERRLLDDAAAIIVGNRDFSGFCRAASRKESSLCCVTESSWQSEKELLVYHVRADRFLHEMVRLLVGT